MWCSTRTQKEILCDDDYDDDGNDQCSRDSFYPKTVQYWIGIE